MSEEKHPIDVHPKNRRLALLIVLVITGAVMLTWTALSLYSSSGAAQLDLSRPGFERVREQVASETTVFKAYPNSGPIDEESLKEFETKYGEKVKEATSVKAFGNDVLSPEALHIDRSSAESTER